jgi:uncharacterized protein (DUF433 family)
VLGKGVYTLSEVSRYADLPVATLRSWFKPRSDSRGHGPIFRSDYASIDGDYAVSFLNLIEAYVARFFRKEGVQPPVIRRAREILADELATRYPFAHAELCTDGCRIIRKTHEIQLVDVISKQHFFTQMCLGQIKYNKDSKLAEAWHIREGVLIDPKVAFGHPVIERTGVTTFVLANQYAANQENAALVADLYGVGESDVLNAVRFEEAIRRRAAA